MGSLYEPSIRSSTWTVISRRLSRRFTTLEGWREIGLGVYTMGSSNVRMFSIRHQFDPEHIRDESDDGFDFTTPRDAPPVPSIRRSFVEQRRSSEGTIGKAIGSVRDTKGVVITQAQRRRAHPPEPYHAFSKREKWTLVAIVGAAGIFPIMTFNIYLPVVLRIAADFKVNIEAINLTITTSLILQGIASVLWAPLSDSLGRRSVYIYSFVIYIISNIVLSFSPNFTTLLIFRGIQAASVASTVSIGCAVIQDISLASEREDFHSFFQGIRNAALVIAPIIGGLTANWANFRCIFIILFALSLALLAALLFFLPETLRSIAGNGTLPLTGMYQPFLWRCKVFGEPAHLDERFFPVERPNTDYAKFVEPLKLLKEKDIVLSLVFGGIIFAIWMMVTVSTVPLFRTAFGLGEVFLGLAFIPNAIGTIAGSTLIGNLLNQDLHRSFSLYKRNHSLPPSVTISRHPFPADFPLEHTRLVRLPGLVVIFVIALSFYGFTLYYPSLTSLGGWIAIPLLLQFLIAVMAHAICGIHQTLIADLWPKDGAAAANASNLVRCMLAAILVAVVQRSLDTIEVGPTFLAMGLVVMILVPLPIVQWYWGGDWRRVRETRLAGDNTMFQSEKV